MNNATFWTLFLSLLVQAIVSTGALNLFRVLSEKLILPELELLGYSGAVILAVLMALWPAHYNQQDTITLRRWIFGIYLIYGCVVGTVAAGQEQALRGWGVVAFTAFILALALTWLKQHTIYADPKPYRPGETSYRRFD